MEVKFFKRIIAFLVVSGVFIIAIVCTSNIYNICLLPQLWISTLRAPYSSVFPPCDGSETLWMNYTETAGKECSVPVYEETNERLYAYKNDISVLCNRHIFRKYHEQRTCFVSQGSWNLLRLGGRIRHAYFRTPFCSFSHQDFNFSSLSKCFASQRVRRILTLGDSNGRRTFDALKDIVSSSLRNCRMVNREQYNFMPDMNYYLGPGNYTNTASIIVQKRRCRTCGAVQYKCYYGKGTQNYSLITEHVPMNFILDGSIRIRDKIRNVQPTNFTHEFIMRDYLRDKIPSIIIVMIPCGHERTKLLQGKKQYVKEALRQYIKDIKKYIPASTQIYWVPYHYIPVQVPFKPAHVHLCNEMVFDAIRDDLRDPTSNMHATLNTFPLSCPFKELRTPGDPVHMNQKWYELFSRQILQQICNEQ